MRLTKRLPLNGLMFLLFMGIGIIAYIKPGRFINELFIVLSIILIIDGMYFFSVLSYLDVSIYIPKVIQKGEKFILEINITNKSFLPSPYIYVKPKDNLRIKLEEKQARVILLGANRYKKQYILCNPLFYGKEQMELEEVSIRSFIGFFRKSVSKNIFTTIKILPAVKQLEYIQCFDAFLTSLNIEKDKQDTQGGHRTLGDEVGYQLSPYVEGDSQRLIHWKIVASRGEYLVRQREERKEQKRGLFFILNPFIKCQNSNEEVIIQDKIVTSLISLVAYYLGQDEKIRVAYFKNKKWQHVVLRESKEIYTLQDILSNYEGMKVEQDFNNYEIIKGILKIAHKESENKMLMSSYWEEDLEKYILESQLQELMLPIICTHSNSINYLTNKSSVSIWYMTDEYGLVFCSEEKLEEIKAIDEI